MRQASERRERAMAKLSLRIDFDDATRLGPGKIRLLELIGECGSISAAGRGMGMSYRRAWLLVDSLNRSFKEPVVLTQLGGSGGGGAALSDLGQAVVADYRAMEHEVAVAIADRIAKLERALVPGGAAPGREPRR
jgi:molybdate transport system regulatory protein